MYLYLVYEDTSGVPVNQKALKAYKTVLYEIKKLALVSCKG